MGLTSFLFNQILSSGDTPSARGLVFGVVDFLHFMRSRRARVQLVACAVWL